MKKIILFALFSGVLFAQTKSDVSLTAGYNKFDDPLFLRNGHMAYGIRGGVYKDNGLGYQLGFEHISNANCKGLKLNRIYTNALMMFAQQNKLIPYGLVTAGYEMSSISKHKPNQLFMGAGLGAKYELTPNVNAFIETRILQKLKSHDSDVITTLGLSYVLDSEVPSYTVNQEMQTIPEVITKSAKVLSSTPSQHIVLDSDYTVPSQPLYTHKRDVQPINIHVEQSAKNYYIQLVALSQNSANPFLSKLHAEGITNAQIQQVYRNSNLVSIVVVGPYQTKSVATKNLKRFKSFTHGAFVTEL